MSPMSPFVMGSGQNNWPGKAHAENYLKNVRAIFREPALYIVVVGFMLLYGFWAGITAGVVIPFLMPILAKSLEIVFAPLGRLIRKKFRSPSSNKPPDSPQTP